MSPVGRFRPGPGGRPGARCPKCRSLERDRFLSLLLGTLSCTAWALFGSALRPVLTSRRAVRAFNIVMAVLLLASLYPLFMDA